MRKRSNLGFGLVELMVATIIFTILVAAGVQLHSTMNRASKEVFLAKAEDRDIANILEKVIKQFNQQQISFSRIEMESSDPKLNNLPLAWNDEVIVPVERCPNCSGRMGISARPHPSLPGIFVVSVRLTNAELFHGVKDYKFLSVYK
jgi:prepilin-type N-terminal cleavage/methylation domain-containing protein